MIIFYFTFFMFFLSNLQTDNGGCIVDLNQAATGYFSLYVFIFPLQFSNIKSFVALFSGTMRPTHLKLGTHVNNR